MSVWHAHLPPRIRYAAYHLSRFSLAIAVLLCAVCAYFAAQAIVIVRSGQAGVLYALFDGGTVTDRVYGEGFHLVAPWNRMTLYDVRTHTVLHQFGVLTKDGLEIELRLAIRYHPQRELLGLLHQNIGPDYVESMIVPQIESVMRKYIGRQSAEDVYTNKDGVLADITAMAIDEAGRRYVAITDLIIRSVTLPPSIRQAIADKLVHEQQLEAYGFVVAEAEQEASRRRIEAKGIRDAQAIVGSTLSPQVLTWQGIQATETLAKSQNSKVVVIGSGKNGLPLMLGDH
jgi:regulator of protease activity HflC (stomatin/prohibitin superfamily)